MKKTIVMTHQGTEKYKLSEHGKEISCKCGCVIFDQSGDRHICNSCGCELGIDGDTK